MDEHGNKVNSTIDELEKLDKAIQMQADQRVINRKVARILRLLVEQEVYD